MGIVRSLEPFFSPLALQDRTGAAARAVPGTPQNTRRGVGGIQRPRGALAKEPLGWMEF